jgi:hypothetical protein
MKIRMLLKIMMFVTIAIGGYAHAQIDLPGAPNLGGSGSGTPEGACFSEVVGYYSPTDAGRFCNNVSNTCYSKLREISANGPVFSAQHCKAVSKSCFLEMIQYTDFLTAAQDCTAIDEDCFVYQRDKFSGPMATAASCSLTSPPPTTPTSISSK